MADILIRDIPDEVVSAIDAKARRLGVTRSAYLRRALERERASGSGHTSIEQLARLSSLAADLDDPAVMLDAWS